jgi:hypothetical protein
MDSIFVGHFVSGRRLLLNVSKCCYCPASLSQIFPPFSGSRSEWEKKKLPGGDSPTPVN